MSITRNNSSDYSINVLESIVASLSEQLLQIEAHMILGYNNQDTINKLKPDYKTNLDALITLLRELSYRCLKDNAEFEETFYINLKQVVQYSILSLTTINQIVFCTERWIIIMKSCYETQDYLSAYIILHAISLFFNHEINLEKNLSMTAKSILTYYRGLFTESSRIYLIQSQQLKNGKFVLPVSLELPQQYRVNFLQDEKFMPIMTNKGELIYKQLSNLSFYPIQHLLKDYIGHAISNFKMNKLKIDMNIICIALSIYGKSDRFYTAKYNASLLTKRIMEVSDINIKQIIESLNNDRLSFQQKVFSIDSYLTLYSRVIDKKLLNFLQQIKTEFELLNEWRYKMSILEPSIDVTVLNEKFFQSTLSNCEKIIFEKRPNRVNSIINTLNTNSVNENKKQQNNPNIEINIDVRQRVQNLNQGFFAAPKNKPKPEDIQALESARCVSKKIKHFENIISHSTKKI